jgi:phage gpG-like protein
MRSDVLKHRSNRSQLEKRLAMLSAENVLVGVPADKTGRRPEDGESGPITNAALAYIHDNGAPEANIPARPFMRPGIADAERRIVKRMESGLKRHLAGDGDAIRVTLEGVGLIAQTAIRKRIAAGDFTPLAPATLAARLRRGRTGTRPLIDSGQLRNSITYVIRKRGKLL